MRIGCANIVAAIGALGAMRVVYPSRIPRKFHHIVQVHGALVVLGLVGAGKSTAIRQMRHRLSDYLETEASRKTCV